MMKKSCAKRPRLPQRARAQAVNLPPMRVTPRDKEILEAVYAYRTLTTQQISDLLFVPVERLLPSPPSSRCLHRLKLLFHHGFLHRDELPHLLREGRKPFLYQLDRAGAALLATWRQCAIQELDWQPDARVGHQFLEHLQTTNDVRIALMRAARRHAFSMATWIDDKTLKTYQKDTVILTGRTGRKQRAAVVPDGYFHLDTGTHHYHHFLEVDRATVTGSSQTWGKRTWARKVMAFIEYYRSGKYHARYHTKGLRILTVTTGEKRLENLRAITADAGGMSRFWFTTLTRMHGADVLTDAIWEVAGQEGRRSLIW